MLQTYGANELVDTVAPVEATVGAVDASPFREFLSGSHSR
jgi:hypothetical protein